ncbi:MAG: asparagine synthase (glutamine-hydrolyzing), partial [Candidatus Bipolaricaulia bacterium]
MCGITGVAFAGAGRIPDLSMLRAMTDTLRHRGPDGEGYHLDSGVGLGVRRLSIIDLETGDQPISNENGSVVVVCNGEIYNYVELRNELEARGHVFRSQSDTEVIVHLYEESGTRCLERLRGMFAFAIWDAVRSELLLARDRFGIKPLYYAPTEDGVYFGSEQKAILASRGVGREVDLRGLHDLLTMGFVVAPSTLFAAIRQLEPGTFLVYREGELSIARYWDVAFPRRSEALAGRTDEAWASALLEKLDETVSIHLRSDVPVGAWLSPGIDSSTIVALMARHRGGPIHTTTLGFEAPEADEVQGQKSLIDFAEHPLVSRMARCCAAD